MTAAVAVLACAGPQAPAAPVLAVQPDALELATGETRTIDVTTDGTDPPVLTFRCYVDGSFTAHAPQPPEGCAVTAQAVGSSGATWQYSVTGVQPGTAVLYFRLFGEGLCSDPFLCQDREIVVLASGTTTVTVR